MLMSHEFQIFFGPQWYFPRFSLNRERIMGHGRLACLLVFKSFFIHGDGILLESISGSNVAANFKIIFGTWSKIVGR